MTDEERLVAKWHTEWLKSQRKYFVYADASQYLLEQQKEDDLLLLQEWFVGVMDKLKEGDKRGAELTLLLQSIWRIQSYCGGLETICRASIVKFTQGEERIKDLESQLKLAQYQIIQDKAKYDSETKSLRNQIEFIEKNNKP
jgi:hypothetical protein